MTKKWLIRCIGLLYIVLNSVYASSDVVMQQLQVKLMPYQQSLQVIARISRRNDEPFDFILHAGLQPEITSDGARLIKTGNVSSGVEFEKFRVFPASGQTETVLTYAGKIAHDFSERIESPGREQRLLAGTISAQGVFLDGGVAWYPQIQDTLYTFTLRVDLPAGWSVVSQGKGPEKTALAGTNKISWTSEHPQDDIYLIAGEYQVYTKDANEVQAQVFLRNADEKLAQRYLDTTHQYIRQYEELIGKYAYAKFALVENFWETGYGMPSFTLLGPRVIRLPFILHSSYPHEILHNWWGNGVFVDYDRGNWSEGLTAYLADHLIKEQRGQGSQHRRVALQRYADFVRSDNDFPLIQFRSRHSGSSQSVGYDKSMMFYHMLRKKLGDQTFIEGLRQFYSTNLFRSVGFSDLQFTFEQVSDLDLSGFFKQWLERVGVPELKIEDIQATQKLSGYTIDGTISQIQSGAPYSIDVPVIVYMQQGTEPEKRTITVDKKTQSFSINVPARPVRLDVDPWFDLFRKLDSSESPPTLSGLFGSQKILFILPASAPQELLDGYKQMASQWAKGYERASIKFDHDLHELPKDQPVWLLGWNNRFFKDFQQGLETDQFNNTAGSLTVSKHSLDIKSHSLVMTRRNQSGQILGWVGTENQKSIAGLTRKLPHYGKYSYLAFDGDQPNIQHKGQWDVTLSPMKKLLTKSDEKIKEVSPVALWPLNP